MCSHLDATQARDELPNASKIEAVQNVAAGVAHWHDEVVNEHRTACHEQRRQRSNFVLLARDPEGTTATKSSRRAPARPSKPPSSEPTTLRPLAASPGAYVGTMLCGRVAGR